ncbi:protein-L-isoaspartate O-methyltransferase [Candidatus Pacearchaeota archaeon]|nr:protein-L-isoaspartate O-methyltransferase [Candidatus Pacearchaeota archaeon]
MNKPQLIEHLKQENFPENILDAFSKVKRENFISNQLKDRAYEDAPLSIGKAQTISQPYTIAVMLEMLDLKLGQKVLELGSGSGYVLALISEIVGKKGKIYGIEIIPELAEKSKENTKNYKNIKVYNKDGKQGLKEKAPFDKILISAACEIIPKKVLSQLKDKGLIVAPVGPRYNQNLVIIERKRGGFKIKRSKKGFIFVPFV